MSADIDASNVKVVTVYAGDPAEPDPVVQVQAELDALKAKLKAKAVLTKADVDAIESAAASAVEVI